MDKGDQGLGLAPALDACETACSAKALMAGASAGKATVAARAPASSAAPAGRWASAKQHGPLLTSAGGTGCVGYLVWQAVVSASSMASSSPLARPNSLSRSLAKAPAPGMSKRL